MLLYGVFPHVLRQVEEAMRGDSPYSLHFRSDGGCIVMSLVFVELTHVRTVYLGVVDCDKDWERRLVEILASYMCNDEAPAIPGAVVVDETTAEMSKLSKALFAGGSAVVSRLDTNWLMSLIRQESLKVFHGVEPLSVVEFLRVRFLAASGSSILARFPVLKKVSMWVFYYYVQVKGIL